MYYECNNFSTFQTRLNPGDKEEDTPSVKQEETEKPAGFVVKLKNEKWFSQNEKGFKIGNMPENAAVLNIGLKTENMFSNEGMGKEEKDNEVDGSDLDEGGNCGEQFDTSFVRNSSRPTATKRTGFGMPKRRY